MTNYRGSVAIEVRDLRVIRGTNVALHGLSLTVPVGEVIGLLGPSGCGKTTLMRSIVGVQKISAGTVTVLGYPAGMPRLRRRVGYVTQDASIYDDLTVRQNLRYFRAVLGAAASEVDRVIELTDLAQQATQMVCTLSGG
ncbi:MAG: type transport system ATP-binding protein [Microbacteriaceae bacterium]|nr:type transport system ATP-binding protein [Microbacteriaceae bacterium]